MTNTMHATETGAAGQPAEPTSLPPSVALAFAPLHKRAFGTAIGITAGLVVALVTALHLLLPGASESVNLDLLGEYFWGYTASWRGVVIGFGWASFVGFVAGWFLAFCRNLVLATMIFVGRTRAELAATRDFLDHI